MDNRIRDLREDHDMTQQQVADKIGITQRKYSYIETETQPLTDEILVALSKLYNVSIDYILKQTEFPNRYKKWKAAPDCESRAVILFCIIKKLTIFHFLHSAVHKLEHGKVGFALSPLSRSKIKNETLIVRNDIPQRSNSPVVKYFLFGMLYSWE